jgi:PilZ domain
MPPRAGPVRNRCQRAGWCAATYQQPDGDQKAPWAVEDRVRSGTEEWSPVEQRRRAPRQGACWFGRYTVEGRRRAQWHECLVVDISTLGLGLNFDGGISPALIGERVLVELHIPGATSVNIRLSGEVRHAAQDVRGGARIGVEFVGLSEVERSILDTLELEHVG